MAPSAVETAAFTVDEIKSKTPAVSDPIRAALDASKARFVERNPKSQAHHQLAVESLPGGNTRSAIFTAPFPLCMKFGKEYKLVSEDDHTYTDFVGELTAGLYGHSHPVIISTIKHVLDNIGLNLGSTIAQEHLYASEMRKRFALDLVRFTNSGTEANLHALAVARAFTGKRKVVVFAGGYHGGVYGFPGGKPGVNNVDLDDWIVAKYNDLDSAKAAIRTDGVAAVLIEGMQGGTGAVPGKPEFLKGLEAAAKEANVLFILDEVMTSRVAPGGLAGLHGLKPDLKSFGKYLGGGLAFGAFGGRRDVMALYDPRIAGSLAHSGTFNNNSLVLHAGYAGLSQVYTPEVCVDFNAVGTRFRERLSEVAKGTKMCWTGVGTILASHFTEEGLETLERETPEIQGLKDLFFYEMLEDGFWLVRRGNISLILGTPQSELDRFVDSVAGFLERHSDILKLSP